MSISANAPPPPPKDIPATLRLGTNLLGLGIGPMPGDEEEEKQKDARTGGAEQVSSPVVVIASSSPARPPKPTHFVPLRTTSPGPLNPPPVISNARPASPSTPRSSKHNNRIGERYHENSQSSSTVSLGARSTCTITPASPSGATGSSSMRGRRPSGEWGWKRGTSSSDHIDRPSLTSSVSSSAVPSLGRKRSSGQLLTGLGKGLGRMGSVMRRNTSDAVGSLPGDTPEKPASAASKSRTWRRKGKSREGILTLEDGDAMDRVDGGRPSQGKVEPVPGDEGDAGIGRPYNVEVSDSYYGHEAKKPRADNQHDLHVSPSLDDLPPAWLESLRAQGLSEQDLMLIASARKRQHAATQHAIAAQTNRTKVPHLSEPPKSIHSMPRSVGGSSTNLLSGSDELRRRGASTPETGITSFTTSQEQLASKSPSASSSTAALGLPQVKPAIRLHPKFFFEPSATTTSVAESEAVVGTGPFQMNMVPAAVAAVDRGEKREIPTELLDFGDARRRTPKKNKRMSDQLRCFSQFDIGGEEGWAASLLSVMNAEQVPVGAASPARLVGAVTNNMETLDHAPPSHPSTNTSSDSAPRNRSTSASSHGSQPMTPLREKAIKRIPIPPLLPDTTPEPTLDLAAIGLSPTRSPRHPVASPRPPPSTASRRPSADTTDSAAPRTASDEPVSTPLRKSSEFFGVHDSQSKSSVELDLVTPSSSSHPDRGPSPRSSDDDDDDDEGDISVNDSGSILDFAGALREGGFDYTPGSSVSKELKEYLPGLFDTSSPSHRLSRRMRRPSGGGGYTPRSMHDPAYSVPASVSSCMPSRSPTPELPHYTSPHARTPISVNMREDRISATYSVMSSDSGHLHNSLHEATVQTAYTKVLGKLQEEANRREALGMSGGMVRRVSGVDRIAEESEYGDGDVRTDEDGQSEAGQSAIHALDEAARRFANVHV